MANSKTKPARANAGEERFVTSGKSINVIKPGGGNKGKTAGKSTGKSKGGGR